jgi:hypothetical protein
LHFLQSANIQILVIFPYKNLLIVVKRQISCL